MEGLTSDIASASERAAKLMRDFMKRSMAVKLLLDRLGISIEASFLRSDLELMRFRLLVPAEHIRNSGVGVGIVNTAQRSGEEPGGPTRRASRAEQPA
ncbi:hypothetical protein [Pyrodictium abyssi]|uniref:Uncharacterized protein n=1 Tax=Pyrodictium abyssi TaxID=54256 RepID=A0ABN6ZSS4_9CREN|nr:hypothetical protein PABY_12170 [Pyrodictium abyssi]